MTAKVAATALKITRIGVTFGCDPELFFAKDGKIIGSEKVLPKEGLTVRDTYYSHGKVVRDGIQVEINPKENSCRALLGNSISQCFRQLSRTIQADESLSVNFSPVVKVSKKELASLDEKSRTFGCAPSLNTNKASEGVVKTVDPEKYPYRSAAGHIHLGLEGMNVGWRTPAKLPTLINLCDVLVAIPCVLIDRDPGNVERRKVYGRAGEYRLPEYGVEYRTLSNFWLRAYPLMSFVMGMSRLVASTMYSRERASWVHKQNKMNVLTYDPGMSYRGDYDKVEPFDFAGELLSKVEMSEVHRVINENDFDGAWAIWTEAIRPWIEAYVPDTENSYSGVDPKFSLEPRMLDDFEYFVKMGLDYWWPPESHDPFTHWVHLPDGHRGGWETMILVDVPNDRMKAKRQAKTAPAPAVAAEAPPKKPAKKKKVAEQPATAPS
jgi:hypothetical protein